jgi:hypothetical protein
MIKPTDVTISMYVVFYLYVVKSLHVSGPLAHPQEIHTAVDTTIGSVFVPFWSHALYFNVQSTRPERYGY